MTQTLAPLPPPKAAPAKPMAVPKLGRVPTGNLDGAAIVINACEGWGKSSAVAFAPEPAILMARGETGFVTLRKAGRVPDVDAVELGSWKDTLAMVRSLATTSHKTIGLDATGGFERLCHEYVCTQEYSGDWGEKGFTGFMRGYEVALPHWLELLQALEVLKSKGKNIVLLSHAKVKNFKNPMGSDFDRYIGDMHEKTWAITLKWADAVLFGNFVTVTEEKRKGKVKGIGGTERTMYTQRTDAFDSKNRYGMPERLDIPEDPSQIWPTIWNSMNNKNANAVAPSVVDDVPPEE